MDQPLSVTIGVHLSDNLLDLLDEAFPPLAPVPGDSHEQIMYDAGKRAMVEWLRYCKATADEASRNPTIPLL